MQHNLDKESFIANEYGDNYLYSVNRERFNQSGSRAVFQDVFEGKLFHENTLYFVIGTDSGMLANYVDDRGVPSGSRYVFIEPPVLLKKIAPCLKLNNKRIRFAPPGKAILVAESQSKLGTAYYAYHNKIKIVESLCAVDDAIGLYRDIKFDFEEHLAYHIHKSTVVMNSRPHIRNRIYNAADAVYPLLSFRNFFDGKQALVLSAGPSLELNLNWIKEKRNSFVVIAVSRIAGKLAEYGIQPDFVVTVDPTSFMFHLSKGMLGLKNSMLLYSAYASPMLVGQWLGPAAYIGDRLPWDSPLNLENCQTVEPSVTHTAVGIARWFGCSRVILIGVDLCYTVEGKAYTSDPMVVASGIPIGFDLIKVITNSGGKAYATPDLIKQIESMTGLAKELQKEGVELYNPSPDSAQIPGIEYVDLNNITYADFKKSAYEEALEVFGDQDIESYLSAVHAEFEVALDALEMIISISNKALEILSNENQKSVLDHTFAGRSLQQYKMILSNEKMGRVVKSYGWAEFAKISEILDLTKDVESSELVDQYARQSHEMFFHATIKSARELLLLINEGLYRCNTRILEYAESPDVSALLEAWRKSHQPRRGLGWASKHPQLVPSDSIINNDFKALEVLFNKQLASIDKNLQRSISKKTELKYAIDKLNKAFEVKDMEMLDLLTSITKNHSDKEAPLYADLVAAIKYEALANHAEAIPIYESLADCENLAIRRMALEHIFHMAASSNNLDAVKHSLKMLSEISPDHKLVYSDVLAMNGEMAAAIMIIDSYLSKYNNDVVALLKKAALMEQVDMNKEANDIYTKILKIDADNTEARRKLVALETN